MGVVDDYKEPVVLGRYEPEPSEKSFQDACRMRTDAKALLVRLGRQQTHCFGNARMQPGQGICQPWPDHYCSRCGRRFDVRRSHPNWRSQKACENACTWTPCTMTCSLNLYNANSRLSFNRTGQSYCKCLQLP